MESFPLHFSNFLYPIHNRFPCGYLAQIGMNTGLPCFRINNTNEGLGANYFPMVLLSSFGYSQKPKPTMLPFG